MFLTAPRHTATNGEKEFTKKQESVRKDIERDPVDDLKVDNILLPDESFEEFMHLEEESSSSQVDAIVQSQGLEEKSNWFMDRQEHERLREACYNR